MNNESEGTEVPQRRLVSKNQVKKRFVRVVVDIGHRVWPAVCTPTQTLTGTIETAVEPV